MARLRAHLRRRPGPQERTCIEVGRLRLDLLARRAYLGPEELAPEGSLNGSSRSPQCDYPV
jgi:DNA-binding response OmpR family regulator